MTNAPTTMSVPDFAAHIGFKRTYGYELKKTGRLVMTEDGKKVLVAESIAHYNATKDPSKAGVALRHAQARAESVEAPAPIAVAVDEPSYEDGEGTRMYSFQGAKAKREHWAAEREHAAYLKEAGELMERSAVVAAFADAGTTLRSALEAWQSTLPPTLVGLDEGAIRTTLADQTERLLLDLVEKFGRLAEQDPQ